MVSAFAHGIAPRYRTILGNTSATPSRIRTSVPPICLGIGICLAPAYPFVFPSKKKREQRSRSHRSMQLQRNRYSHASSRRTFSRTCCRARHMQRSHGHRLAIFNPNATGTPSRSSPHQSRRPMSQRWGAEAWSPLQDAYLYGQGPDPQERVDKEQQQGGREDGDAQPCFVAGRHHRRAGDATIVHGGHRRQPFRRRLSPN